MAKKQIPIPHIPLKYEDAVREFLKVKPEPKPPKKKAPKKVSRESSSQG